MARSRFSSVCLFSLAPLALAVAGCPADPEPSDDDDGAEATTGDAVTSDTGDGDTGMTGDESGEGSGTAGLDDTGSESSGSEPAGVECINAQFVNGPSPGPTYEEFEVTVGSHCQGTDHQDITDIERVVFIGDSVTVGTPPTSSADFYRSELADQLVDRFGLEAPEVTWKQANALTGMSSTQESGGFASCAEWGARNDDLMSQLEACFANPEDFDKRTLVISTMGGNDASNLAQDAIDGVPAGDLFTQLEQVIAYHEEALDWLVGDPDKFPNGIFVVNANVYEYTDYTVDVLSCPAADVAGFSDNPDDPMLLLSSLNLINEEYMRIAVEHGTDVVFMFEGFCGHGFKSFQDDNVCYRGPDEPNWFDFTCIHPTPTGHGALAEMFFNVISE